MLFTNLAAVMISTALIHKLMQGTLWGGGVCHSAFLSSKPLHLCATCYARAFCYAQPGVADEQPSHLLDVGAKGPSLTETKHVRCGMPAHNIEC